MRIIAGSAGGLQLKVPPGVTRPTTDRVREAIFSMLGDLIRGARVLDLFAGSGGMGLESLSRGATEAVFVEQNGPAAAILQGNMQHARLLHGKVVKAEAFTTLRKFRESREQFDIAFADPPYAKKPGDVDHGAQLLQNADLRHVLKVGGFFVLETMVTKGGAGVIADWEVIRDRAYGSTRILILQLPNPNDGETSGADALQSSAAADAAGHGPQGMEEDEGARGEGG